MHPVMYISKSNW